jgi:hypothetical protein
VKPAPVRAYPRETQEMVFDEVEAAQVIGEPPLPAANSIRL